MDMGSNVPLYTASVLSFPLAVILNNIGTIFSHVIEEVDDLRINNYRSKTCLASPSSRLSAQSCRACNHSDRIVICGLEVTQALCEGVWKIWKTPRATRAAAPALSQVTFGFTGSLEKSVQTGYHHSLIFKTRS